MTGEDPLYELALARTDDDLRAAQRLRYRVFVQELGADGPMVDHAAGLERDAFDALCDHLVLIDRRRPLGDHVVAAYRLLPGDRLGAGRFYSEAEYDLTPLRASGRRLLELGRSCVDADHRGGAAMLMMWNGLAGYVLEHGTELMFGVASFHGTDVAGLAQPLAWLHHHHLAPPALRVTARPPHGVSMNLLKADQIDRKRAVGAMPSLLRAYLRLGGVVGDGAFVDHGFNTVDVCLIMDTAQLSARHRDFHIRHASSAL
ncbi:GNAT family N-acetyltransferase [Neogemmobacter tilapiae]|uniref:L-ornithine N(alpha)-acyltransferase n=1 Tax=Neogemmobacter tilapiae TaxID=875041 RepID=A0A918TU70_9RHOB|nr:GNAT family N-acyltransferase [Gemmobacter tilapiae]GHC62810.1 ornithine-acyl-ACP acyltransferase [Gemmobacter tilapiae]